VCSSDLIKRITKINSSPERASNEEFHFTI